MSDLLVILKKCRLDQYDICKAHLHSMCLKCGLDMKGDYEFDCHLLYCVTCNYRSFILDFITNEIDKRFIPRKIRKLEWVSFNIKNEIKRSKGGIPPPNNTKFKIYESFQ